MRAVVTHLTRMAPGYVCIAGIVPGTGEHIRPVARGRRIRRTEIELAGGEIQIGTEVELGPVRPTPNAPEVEDHEFSPDRLHRIRNLTPLALEALLDSAAENSLFDIFGPELEADGATASVAVGAGRASLGCLLAASPPDLFIDRYKKVKLALDDGGETLTVTVADLRLYDADQTTPAEVAVEEAQRRLSPSARIYLSVGLSRPFTKPGEARPRHWLQINNIHSFS